MTFSYFRERASRARDIISRDGGFTLIEVLAVMVIVGLLAAVAVPQISKWREKAAITSAMQDARNIVMAVEAMANEIGVIDEHPEYYGFDDSPLNPLDETLRNAQNSTNFDDLQELLGYKLSKNNEVVMVSLNDPDFNDRGSRVASAWVENTSSNVGVLYMEAGEIAEGAEQQFDVSWLLEGPTECDSPDMKALKQSFGKGKAKRLNSKAIVMYGRLSPMQTGLPEGDYNPIC